MDWSLPKEVSENIFAYLDHKSLLEASAVCKDWRGTILNSKKLVKHIDFELTNFSEQAPFLVEHGRAFSKVSIGTSKSWLKRSPITLGYGDLRNLFQYVCNIKELEINKFRPSNSDKFLNLDLAHLKKITINDNANNSRVYNFLAFCKPTELVSNIGNVNRDITYFPSNFWSWLDAQAYLKDLTLTDYAIIEFFKEANAAGLNIKLKKLTLSTSYSRERFDEINLETLLDFLKKQNEIEEMDLRFFNIIASGNYMFEDLKEPLYNQILFNMQSLKSLSIKGEMIGDTNIPQVNRNLNIEKLTLEKISLRSVEKFYTFFPYIKNLKIVQSNLHPPVESSQIMRHLKLISNLWKLEKLKLSHFSLISTLHGVQFQYLKKIKMVKCQMTEDDWLLLTNNCRMVEVLILDLFKISNDSVRQFVNWRNLKKLEFRCGYYQNGLTEILMGCPGLKQLNLSISMKRRFWDHLRKANWKIGLAAKSVESDYDGQFRFPEQDNANCKGFICNSRDFH